MPRIYQNTVKRYHSLSAGKFAKYYETVDKLYEQVSFSFKGVFDACNLKLINEYITSVVELKYGSRTGLFKIFLELAQNIAENSIDASPPSSNVGAGMMIITEFSDHFEIIAANPAKPKDAEKAKLKCDKINSCSKDELRAFRREQLKLPAGKTGNGNIGLIKVVLVSSNKISCSILHSDDNFSFIIFKMLIKK